MSETVIKVENLSKRYRLGTIGGKTLREDVQRWWAKLRGKPDPLLKIGDEDHGNITGENLWALRDVSFEIKQGEILGIIGKNGAGKSTLLKIISQITAPTSGEIKIKGRIGSLLEVGTGFHPELTGRENIYLNGAILGMSKQEVGQKLNEIIDFAELKKFIDTPVKRYSSGMYVRLAFAVAAHLDPEILVVDEVLAVGDAQFQKKCIGKMKDVSGQGRTVLFVSHNMESISKLTERCLVMEKGQIIMMAPTEEAVTRYTDVDDDNALIGVPMTIDEIDFEHHITVDERACFHSVGLSSGGIGVIASGGCISLEVSICTKCLFKDLNFGYTVKSNSGASILNGYSPLFRIDRPGIWALQFDIEDLYLAPGNYYLSLSICRGNDMINKKIFDMLLGFGRFRVKSQLGTGEILPKWNKGWGYVLHSKSMVKMIVS